MVVPLFWRIEMEGIVAKIWNIKEGTMGRGAAVQITDSISYITNSEKCDGVIVNDDFMQVGREVSYQKMFLWNCLKLNQQGIPIMYFAKFPSLIFLIL